LRGLRKRLAAHGRRRCHSRARAGRRRRHRRPASRSTCRCAGLCVATGLTAARTRSASTRRSRAAPAARRGLPPSSRMTESTFPRRTGAPATLRGSAGASERLRAARTIVGVGSAEPSVAPRTNLRETHAVLPRAPISAPRSRRARGTPDLLPRVLSRPRSTRAPSSSGWCQVRRRNAVAR